MRKSIIIFFLAIVLSPALRAGDKEKRFKTYTALEKGEWIAGLSALYSGINSNNSQFLLIVEDMDADGNLLRLSPAVSYAYKDNASIGLRFSYSRANLNLDDINLNLFSDDLSLDISKFNASYNSWNAGFFHRNYFGLGPKGNVGLFCEFQLSYAHSSLKYDSDTDTANRFGLTFSPGVIVYIFNFLSFEASIGIADANCTIAKSPSGDFTKWGGGLSFNLLNCNFGLNFHF